MSLTLFKSIKPLSLLRAQHLARASYHPEIKSNKGEEFFVASPFPDDFEAPSILTKRGQGTPSWDEIHATLSEASVKADRGEIKMQKLTRKEGLEKLLKSDAQEPKIDEM